MARGAPMLRDDSTLRALRQDLMRQAEDYQRIIGELAVELPDLTERALRLRSEVDRLERRRDALASEVSESVRTAFALHERTTSVHREIASLELGRDLMRRSLAGDSEQLDGFARRWESVRAECDELSSLLGELQRLTDQPETFAMLSEEAPGAEEGRGA